MRVLVTGGSGFLGRAVVERLLDGGAEVIVADLLAYPGTRARSVVGDLRDPEVLRESVSEELDGIVHLAALTSVLESANRPEETYRTNVAATHGLLEAARLTGIPRFIFASTNAVVGETGGGRIDEQAALRPLTPYGATKAAAEMLLSAYGASYGMAASSLRFTNIYGPGMAHKDSLVARLMKAALCGGSIDIYGDGEQERDYIFVNDAVSAVDVVWEKEISGTFTVGWGSSVSVNALHRQVCDATGVAVGAQRVPSRPGEMRRVAVDNSKMKRLGWEPVVPLGDGLRSTWDYFLAQAKELQARR